MNMLLLPDGLPARTLIGVLAGIGRSPPSRAAAADLQRAPISALIMLAGIYTARAVWRSTPAIMVNLPV